MITCFIAFATILVDVLSRACSKKQPSMLNTISGLLRIPAIALSLLISCWNVSLSTCKMADRYYQRLVDYGRLHPDDPLVLEFAEKYPTYHSRLEYVLTRSADLNGPMVGFFATWAGAAFLTGLVQLQKKVTGTEAGTV
jgi:hypothetical protein